MSQNSIANQNRVKSALTHISHGGFSGIHRIQRTLQGAIYRVCDENDNPLIVKVTNRFLHERRIAELANQTFHGIKEDIVSEANIVKYLCAQHECPLSIVRYVSFFKSDHHYFFVMEKAGNQSLFEFAVKAHKFIEKGILQLCEWRRVVRNIFTQMIEAVDFLHKHNVCHFDVSLENFVINNPDIQEVETLFRDPQTGSIAVTKRHIRFALLGLQCKLIDFGLSSKFVAKTKSMSTVSFKTTKVCGKQFYMAPEMYHSNVENGTLVAPFDARANDIFGLAVCLFMLSVGNPPWNRAKSTDPLFVHILNGNMAHVLRAWNKEHYVDETLMNLLSSMFQYESNRVSLSAVKQHAWLALSSSSHNGN